MDDGTEALYHRHGMHPGWRRVWSDGVDVTDQPVEQWPARYRAMYAEGWRPDTAELP